MATFLVSETDKGPLMPLEAFVALQTVRVQRKILAVLDEHKIPQDAPVRAKAMRLVIQAVDTVYAPELARLQANHAVVEARETTMH